MILIALIYQSGVRLFILTAPDYSYNLGHVIDQVAVFHITPVTLPSVITTSAY